MRYHSTRGKNRDLSFQDAVMMGLAEDGGLLVPDSIPQVSHLLDEWSSLSYPELALRIVSLFCDDIEPSTLRGLIESAYGESYGGPVAPVRQVGDVWMLELIHGPTLAFKDVALQLLGKLFAYILEQRDERLNILAATSGDTGSAAIYGVRGQQRIQIFVMHPRGRIAPLQEAQMTSVLDANVHNLAVEGTFDDCQGLMKETFADLPFKEELHLGAVNSVNWCRVLAQIVYYFSAALEVRKRSGQPRVSFSIPTGNFGNFLAAWYAAQMGLPIQRLLLGTNQNDILARYFNTGEYARGPVHATLAPAMDIQVASNFERFLYYQEPSATAQLFQQFSREGRIVVPCRSQLPIEAVGVSDGEILATIARVYRDHEVVVDPHTAVAFHAALLSPGEEPLITVATAHPAKFPDAIERAIGVRATHPRLEPLLDLPRRLQTMPANAQVLKDFLRRHG